MMSIKKLLGEGQISKSIHSPKEIRKEKVEISKSE